MRYEYVVHRCTTEKLKDYLWNVGQDGWDDVDIRFTGGRDWVLICKREAQP